MVIRLCNSPILIYMYLKSVYSRYEKNIVQFCDAIYQRFFIRFIQRHENSPFLYKSVHLLPWLDFNIVGEGLFGYQICPL